MSTTISIPHALTLAGWRKLTDGLPPEGLEVKTVIADDLCGIRNETSLVRKGHLWFYPDMSMYVYYAPTHWRYLT